MQQPIDQPESPYEQLRRAQNIVSVGTVAEVDHARGRCRIDVGENRTAWLPWLTLRAGGSAALWWPPAVGEQVALLAPGGDMAQAVALPGAYSDAMPAPSSSEHAMVIRWAENAQLVFQAAHATTVAPTLHITIGNAEFSMTDGAISASVPGATLTLDQTGLHVDPEVNVGDITLTRHRHDEVARGSATSGQPVP